jgi:hypothetical protein
MTILEVLNEDLLLETLVKVTGGWKIKKEGGGIMPKTYSSKRAAVRVILGMKSKGGFYNLSKEEQNKRINSYLKNH